MSGTAPENITLPNGTIYEKKLVDIDKQAPNTEPLTIAYLGNSQATTTLLNPTITDAASFVVTSEAGMSVGDSFFIVDPDNGNLDTFRILGLPGTGIVQVDRPAANTYLAGTFAGASNTNMAGAIGTLGSPIAFNLKTGLPAVAITLDLTRIIFTAYWDSGVGTAITFANMVTALTNGILLRKTSANGGATNYFSFKNNLDFAGIAFDFDPFDPTSAPFGGNEGFKCRFSFKKLGAIIQLAENEDLELLVMDTIDMPGTTPILEAVVEGYIVTP